MDDVSAKDAQKIALSAGVLQAFGNIDRPLAAEMIDPDHLAEYGPRNFGACLFNVLARYPWHEVQLANFRVDDDPPPFGSRIEQAEWARGVFELLSSKGVAYYAPSIMLITLKEGETAQPMLDWLIERLDPDCWGEATVNASFGHWSGAQMDTLLQFLDWASSEYPDAVYEEQVQTVQLYWRTRRLCGAATEEP